MSLTRFRTPDKQNTLVCCSNRIDIDRPMLISDGTPCSIRRQNPTTQQLQLLCSCSKTNVRT